MPAWSEWRSAIRAPGAAAGLATAVVAGAVAVVLGGFRVQVPGPTGAMTVVLVPIFHQHGSGGVLAVGLTAGLALVVLTVAGVGRAIRYMPAPVIEGFIAGIAVVIAPRRFPSAVGAGGCAHLFTHTPDAIACARELAPALVGSTR